MHRIISSLVIVALMWGCGPKKMTPEESAKEKKAVESVLSSFWKAYESKDASAAKNTFSASTDLMFFGTDSAEVVKTVTQWETQMKDDWELFETVKFGEMRNLSIQVDGYGELATALYELPVDMTISGKPSHSLFRGANVLKKENGGWRLFQGVVAVATVGQSSAELVAKMKEAKEKKK